MSQFSFLQREWVDVFDAAARAEVAVHRDPRTLAVAWAFKHDGALRLPHPDTLSAHTR